MNPTLQGILDRVAAGYTNTAEVVPRVVADPRGYPREAMLLAVIAVLALLFVITVLLVLVDYTTASVKMRREGVRVRRRATSTRFLVPAAVFIGLCGAVVLVPSFALTSRACGTCHATESATTSWAASSHSFAGCYGCHARPGAFGRLETSLRGAVARVSRSRGVLSASVDSRSCLSCHEDIMTRVVEGRVRMRHADLVTIGADCLECHESIGHESNLVASRRIPRRMMSRCLPCHDGKRAPVGCYVCHSDRPADVAKTPVSASTPAATTCTGDCHKAATLRECRDCHGLELPHSERFKEAHAGQASADPALCAKCHESASPSLACACHPDGQTHGSYSEWFSEHGAMAASSGPGGCKCHDNANYQFCMKCHEAYPW